MKNMVQKQLSLYVCILIGATQAAAGPAAKPDGLLPCPQSPNCVSSLNDNKKHSIEPIDFQGSREEARQELISILKSTKRVRLVRVEPDYIRAEFRSLIFRFVDDVEFYFPAGETIIHVKSASRTGYYDFGVNRRRVEQLRLLFKSSQDNG